MNVEQMAADCLYPEMIPGYDFGICRPPVNERTIEYYEPELMSTTVNCVFFGRNENIFSYLNKNNSYKLFSVVVSCVHKDVSHYGVIEPLNGEIYAILRNKFSKLQVKSHKFTRLKS